MVDLVTSRFRDQRPDILSLMEFEEDCLKCSTWQRRKGPILFPPTKVSTRLFTLLHVIARSFAVSSKSTNAVISLGLPYRHYFFGKTFPHFAVAGGLRILWTYDVWEPRFHEIASIVRQARIGLLLISSAQATEHFRSLRLPGCEVHWVPEVIEVERFSPRPWRQRSVDVVSFGRGHSRYHEAIAGECRRRGIRYLFQPGYPTQASFVQGLADARISICFPRSETHPNLTGSVSTTTLRYLQSMAAKCLVVGGTPFDAERMFGYNPVINVDWNDPVGQIETILKNPNDYLPLVDRNYAELQAHHQPRNFVARVDELIRARLRTSAA